MKKTFKKLESARGILFDLDNTLYPRERGVFDRINERINEFVRRVTGREGPELDNLRREYRDRYGTTLGGLLRHEAVDAETYLAFVHDIPVEKLLEPEPALTGLLRSIELPMMVFTNGTSDHAGRVMEALGVSPFFTGVCDLADTGFLGKPHRKAYERAAGLLGCSHPETIFIDDLPVNVHAARGLGMVTVHVNGHDSGAGDIQVEKVTDLEKVFSGMPWYREGRDQGPC